MNPSINFKDVDLGPTMDVGPHAARGLHEVLLHLGRVHGPRYVLKNSEGERATYFCGSPADVKAVFAVGHRETRGLLQPLIGGGLFTAGTSRNHEEVKRIVGSLFARPRIDDFAAVLQDVVCKEIGKHLHGGENCFARESLLHFAHSLSVCASCAFVFGASVPANVVDAVSRVLRSVRTLLTKAAGVSAEGDPMAELHSAKQDLRLHIKGMVNIPKAFRPTPITFVHELSDRMAEGGYSDEDVFCELLSLLGSGLETTGATVFWALFELTKNGEASKTLITWLRDQPTLSTVLEERDTPLNDVISETLRLYPSGWVMYRKAPEEIVLDDGRRIPRSAIACVSPFVTHRLFADWEMPEEFNPSRFLFSRVDGQSIAQYRFFPFGGGVHRCIGARLATSIIAAVLAELLSKCSISCENAGGIYCTSGLALEPKGDAAFKLVRYGL